MNYKETVDWLFKQLPVYQIDGVFKYKLDLSSIKLVCKSLNNPQKNFKSIHVAGTNGKGSTSHILASVLHESGYKVGLYTSPHLKDFRERIRINGKEIEKDFIVSFVENKINFFSYNNISFFEMTVAMAFEYFSKSKVDIAIIETGLGGSLDATNIIIPELSIITNIGMDHSEFLGNNIKDIAKEKAGIIKKEIPVVVSEYQEEVFPVFREMALKLNSKIYIAGGECFGEYETDLNGEHQKKNIQGAIKSLSLLNNFKISENDIKLGLLNVKKNTGLKGRLELIKDNPKVVVDVGHNIEAFNEIIKYLNTANYKDLKLILGFVKGKNFKKIINILPKEATYYFCKPNVSRGLPVDEILEYSNKIGLQAEKFSSVEEAYSSCLNESSEDDFIFIGGSNFVVAEII
ncbi:MAG: bifunctional folylpolyglutamate synthase/dihydrofolate synthase [Flavobacteriales bacterium]|jgi:dihydrofolate synthase/folylpolyglutamate synthase|tara:strand:- start:2126 stop:3337 length:1212 start_codon:yes stop_codon:yes gene_type:complete